MYYLKPDERGRCIIYGYPPEGEYLVVEELPPPLSFRRGYDQVIVTDLKTAWREYVNPHEQSDDEDLRQEIEELKQLVADLASLQLGLGV